MPLSDEQWRFVVEDVLGVRPLLCEALVDGVAGRHPADERPRALARVIVPRALIAGAPSGLADTASQAVGLALIEQRAMMRHRATLLASLGYLDDRRFFERPGWPRRALGLSVHGTGLGVATSESVRFGLRFAFVRGARVVGRPFGRRVSSWLAMGAGTLFDAVEMIGFAEAALDEREVVRKRALEEHAPLARVVRLPLPRPNGSRGRPHDDDEETTEGP
jgi:hypothetical protein